MTKHRTLRGVKNNLILKRKFRSEMTLAEKKLWLKIRGRQFKIFKFRRQHGIGPYVVDFFCPQKKLVIEIDGDIHAFEEQKQQDQVRENFLKQLGIRIIRYTNNDILKNIQGVMDDLYRKVI